MPANWATGSSKTVPKYPLLSFRPFRSNILGESKSISFFWMGTKSKALLLISFLSFLKSSKGEILVQIQKIKGEYLPLVIQGAEVAGLFNPKKNAEAELTSRMYHFIDDQLEGNQLVWVLALTYFVFLGAVFEG